MENIASERRNVFLYVLETYYIENTLIPNIWNG